MRRSAYFDTCQDDDWPEIGWISAYFLTPQGRRKFFESGNDSWRLDIEGVKGTDDRPLGAGRIDIRMTILGHQDLGVLLFYLRQGGEMFYLRQGGERAQGFYSKGDLSRLHQWIRTAHDDLMPAGLFIPFETAWSAVKDFMERDGALPTSIAWVADDDLPASAFPAPWEKVPVLGG